MLSSRPRLSTTERLRLFNLHGGLCHACGHEIDGTSQRWEIDHVTARGLKARGFACEADTDENMRPAHYRCHKGKTVRDVGAIANGSLPRLVAKQKWCPFADVLDPDTDRPSGNRHRTEGRIQAGSRCVADLCMAWRETSRDHGFCGLAGRPFVPPPEN